MANIKVVKISRDSIKPSSPTLPHLNKVQLSLIDQFIIHSHMPMIFFYQNDQSISYTERSIMLKESLSETLSLFYPLAGRAEETYIHCNDEGVEYYEANVSTDLSKVVARPALEDLSELMPFDPAHGDGRLMLGVQVNHFSCGGMAMCLCVSHKIVDAALYLAFIKAWATTMARKIETRKYGLDDGHHRIVQPQPALSGAFYFPPRELSSLSSRRVRVCKDKVVAKRLVFDTGVLDELKYQASVNVGSKMVVPTRVEVVIAFIWQRIMEAARKANKLAYPMVSYMSMPVSLRERMVPPVPEYFFGNFIWRVMTQCATREDSGLSELVVKLREATTKVDLNLIKTIQNGECLNQLNNLPKYSGGPMFEWCIFSSLCRLPLYEVNFGWGKPLWVCVHCVPMKMVTLLSTKCGKGIEVWITTGENDMTILESDPELLKLAPFRAKL